MIEETVLVDELRGDYRYVVVRYVMTTPAGTDTWERDYLITPGADLEARKERDRRRLRGEFTPVTPNYKRRPRAQRPVRRRIRNRP